VCRNFIFDFIFVFSFDFILMKETGHNSHLSKATQRDQVSARFNNAIRQKLKPCVQF